MSGSRSGSIRANLSVMSKRADKATKAAGSRVLGGKAYAAIAAVEGLRLGPASKKRLATLKAGDLTPDQRRAAVLRAYTQSKGRR